MACLLRLVTAYAASPRHTRSLYATGAPIVYSEEVRRAKMDNKPIVALESTIITHGMPYPENMDTALAVENIIRTHCATPATIGILKGQLNIGLSLEQLEYLAKAKGVVKASRRDLAPVIAGKMDGATTVSGTIIAAELADIPIFVTGGIGGVHRDGENTLDVSADLTELGRCKTLVVCSGVKSILDIGKTLEYLETQGVTVCAFGETHDFPAFYTRCSGHLAPHRAADALHAAQILLAARNIQLGSGIVVAVPVPEKNAMDSNIIEAAINDALLEARRQKIRGKEITPFLLNSVSKATEGASLNTNIALIKNNATVGAQIAVQYHQLKNGETKNSTNINPNYISSRQFHTCAKWHNKDGGNDDVWHFNDTGDVLVIGGANVDRTYRVSECSVQDLSIVPPTITYGDYF